MKINIKNLKYFIFIILVICCIFSVVSIAAVVSDNDGAAFITKAEFDSLKNTFQSEINEKTSSIDSKIDLTISDYVKNVKQGSTTRLTNIYDILGGDKIKFGKPSITPTTVPVTGWALYFVNCWKSGFLASYPGAAYNPIKDPASSDWWNADRGQGVRGGFITYELNEGNKYLSSYKYGLLEAVYVGGWYRVHEHVNASQSQPLGTGPTVLGESCTLGAKSFVDCANSYYRTYFTTDLDLSTWTCAWSIDTDENKVFIESEEYKKPSDYRTVLTSARLDATTVTANPSNSNFTTLFTRGGTVNGSISWSNVDVYGWKYDNMNNTDGKLQTYLNLMPGFYKEKKYENNLCGGVQFFTTGNKAGKVNISNLKFTRYYKNGSTTTTTGDVYFSIRSKAFANSQYLKGDVKMTSLKNATADNTSNTTYRYKASAGDEVTLEFDAKANTTYFIKCQPQSAMTTNNTLYCGISNDAVIKITTES